jgi:DNA-binding MarR family transcriptional regulator
VEENALWLEVYRLLKKSFFTVKKHCREKLSSYGVTWPQYHAFYHISDEGTPFKELADHLGCNASNLTGLIDRMAENGWVYREHSKNDRRVWLVKLTDEGRELKNRLIPMHMQNIKERISYLSEEEQLTLKELLTKLIGS